MGSQNTPVDSQNLTAQAVSVAPTTIVGASSPSIPVSVSSFGGLAAPSLSEQPKANPTAIDVPLALWPSSVTTPPQSISSAPILNLPAGMGALRKRDDPETSSIQSTEALDSRYFADSTVPQQGGGVV